MVTDKYAVNEIRAVNVDLPDAFERLKAIKCYADSGESTLNAEMRYFDGHPRDLITLMGHDATSW